MNRAEDGEDGDVDVVFTIKEGWDAEWLETAQEMDPDLEPAPVNWYNFLEEVNYPTFQLSKTVGRPYRIYRSKSG